MVYYHNISEQVLNILRNDIMMGAFRSGEKLNEQELAHRYKVSRTPLREAIRQLQMEGWVESTPNKGARISSLTEQDIREYFELRRLLERFAAHQAAIRIPESQIQRLQQILKKMRENTAVADHFDNFPLFQDFQSAILQHSGNSLIQQIISQTIQKFARIRFLAVEAKGVHRVYACMEKVIDAFVKRDPAAAEQATIDLLNTYEQVVFDEILKTHPQLVQT